MDVGIAQPLLGLRQRGGEEHRDLLFVAATVGAKRTTKRREVMVGATLAEDRAPVAEHDEVADPVRGKLERLGSRCATEHLLDTLEALERPAGGVDLLGAHVHPAGRAERCVVGDIGIGDRKHDPRAREPGTRELVCQIANVRLAAVGSVFAFMP